MTWTTTPARARAVMTSLPRLDDAVTTDAANKIWGTDATIIRVPSPFAARVLAVAAGTTAPTATGLHRPATLAEALALFGIASTDTTPWSERAYVLEGSHSYSSYWSSEYRRGYLAIAHDGGHTAPPQFPWLNLGASAVLCSGTVAIVADAPLTREAVEPEGVMVSRYADGTIIAAIGWTYVDHRFATRPHTITVADIDAERNEDLRAIAIARYAGPGTSPSEGWLRYLTESGATVLDEGTNATEGTYEALFVSKDRHVLVVTCPTRRLFALGVPTTIKTCDAAQAWIHRDTAIGSRT